LLYGGGAGGGKSWIGCFWLICSALQYPGTRYLLGRAVLKNLKDSTLLTFWDVCKHLKLVANVDYVYNAQNNVIRFFNGSDVYLKDLEFYPSDPEFDSLGSTEYTYAFIDESQQIVEKAKNIVMSRLRYKLDEFGLIPKLLMTSNPAKNFLYYDFYVPHKNNTLQPYRKFVPALASDNPFISKYYIENLQKLDNNTKERLLYGNWEYDDDPAKMIEYEKILDMFTNKIQPGPQKYIIADVARFGKDSCFITYWEGLMLQRCHTLHKSSGRETRLFIESWEREFQVPRSNILLDDDGVGGPVRDEMPGVKGFVNNSSPIQSLRQKESGEDKENFANLKSQCYFKLADYINLGKIGIYSEIPIEIKKSLIEELEQVKKLNVDRDQKQAVVPKEIVKQRLGRSPDGSDTLMMRMYFELRQYVNPVVAGAMLYN
jgi:hypothetical protein